MAANRRRLPASTKIALAVLIGVPVVALLLVPTYARATPTLWGFPFFYWYQFAWMFLTTAMTTVAYRLVVRARRDGPKR
jgi:membrane protein implicated in regulation of membrane protease activity